MKKSMKIPGGAEAAKKKKPTAAEVMTAAYAFPPCVQVLLFGYLNPAQ